TRSTPAACSPSGTTADCTTSASADATPAPTSGCSSRSYTSASSPKTANYYASSPSTQRATTSHNAELQRCHETGVNHVPRHHIGAPGRIRTCDARLRSPALYPLSYEGGAAGTCPTPDAAFPDLRRCYRRRRFLLRSSGRRLPNLLVP